MTVLRLFLTDEAGTVIDDWLISEEDFNPSWQLGTHIINDIERKAKGVLHDDAND